jgi:hypothetical protein
MKGMSASFAFTLNRCTSIHERDMYPSPSGAAKLILSSDSLTISLSSGPALVANNFQRAKPFRLRVAIGANNDDWPQEIIHDLLRVSSIRLTVD